MPDDNNVLLLALRELIYFLVATRGTRTPYSGIVPGHHDMPDDGAQSFVKTFADNLVDEDTVLEQFHVFARAYRRKQPIRLRMRRMCRFHVEQWLPSDTAIRLRKVGTSAVLLDIPLGLGFTHG